MTQYYEAHITMVGDPKEIKPIVEAINWRFSCIDGDINLGEGVKCYATTQANIRVGDDNMIKRLNDVADAFVAMHLNVLRRKVEVVIYDDRSSKVGVCDDCATCQESR